MNGSNTARPRSEISTDDEPLSQQRPGPLKKAMGNLEVPDLLSFSRRSSPRAEDVGKKVKKHETTRKRLSVHQSFDDVVRLLIASSNIVVLSGAGISTSVGIPDFRSDKGLYKKLSEDLQITEPEDFFSNEYFTNNPLQFFHYVKGVLPTAIPCVDGSYKSVDPKQASKHGITSVPEYSPTHAFLALLQSKGKLLTNYTQNIDGLEIAAGLSRSNFIQCHGSWDTATCITCGKVVSARKYLPIAFAGGIPVCKCSQEDPLAKPKLKRQKKSLSGKKRKRTRTDEEGYGSDHSSDQYDGPLAPRGLLKPDITFFEDPITADYKTRLKSDRQKVDLLIVVGTSLKVAPIQQMLYQIPPTVPQIYISKERFSGALCSLPGVQVDIELLGEADVIIEELCQRAKWTQDLENWLWDKNLTTIKGHTSLNSSPNKSTNGDDHSHPAKKIKKDDSTTNDPNLVVRQKNETSVDRQQHIIIENSTSKGTLHDRIRTTITTTRTNTVSQFDGPSDVAAIHQRPQPRDELENTSIHNERNPPSNLCRPDEKKTTKPTSNVKIELVEGTTHQWRVTRKAK